MLKFFEKHKHFKMLNDRRNLKLKQQQQYCQAVNSVINNGSNNQVIAMSQQSPQQQQSPRDQEQQSMAGSGTTLSPSVATAATGLVTPPPIVHRPSPIKKVTIISAKSEELIAATPSERNWRGILIALLVIVAVLGMIVFSIVLVSPVDDGPRVKGRRPTLAETLMLQRLAEKPFNGSWISDTELVYRDPNGGVSVLNTENMTARVLMTNSTFRQLNAVDFKVSSDLKYVLLIANIHKISKYTTLAKYFIYDVSLRTHFSLSPIEDDITAPLLQYAVWSPNGQALAFIHENDIYYKPHVQKTLIYRLTNSAEQFNKLGSAPIIQNGIPDWLYEHEIMNVREGATLWFSPDSQYLVYIQINNTDVGTYKYPWYGGYGSTDFTDLKYPEIFEIKYPKVGTPNPNASVWAVYLNRSKDLISQPVQPPPLKNSATIIENDLIFTYNYIISIKWYADKNLAVTWLNRAQNQSILGLCKAPTFECTIAHIERPDNGAWVHTSNDWNGPLFNQQGDSIQLLPVKDGEYGNYLHLCYINVKDMQVTPITHGRFEVTNILGWDESNQIVYAIATPELRPSERHLYRIGIGNNTQVPWQCMTCPEETMTTSGSTESTVNLLLITNTTNSDDTETDQLLPNKNNDTLICLYNNIILSPDFRYYIQECLGPTPPYVYLYETSSNTKIKTLDPGTLIRNKLKYLAQPQIRDFEIEIEDGYQAQIRLLLPPGHREDEDIMFPLVLLVDAAPGSQIVTEKWTSGWPWYLVANKSYIVAQVDGRGSGFQGERMRTEIHHRLGSVEVQDQLTVLTHLRNRLNYISPTRICIAGVTSYGSYVALTLLATDQNKIVNCTVALSPITNWRLHNTFFTERYLGSSPTDYLHADLVTSQRAQNLISRRLLLAHGTADTEVHSQHAMSLASILVKHEALFTYLTYPDAKHELENVQHHLYKQIDSFFEDTFDLDYDFDRWDQTPESDPATDFFTSFRHIF